MCVSPVQLSSGCQGLGWSAVGRGALPEVWCEWWSWRRTSWCSAHQPKADFLAGQLFLLLWDPLKFVPPPGTAQWFPAWWGAVSVGYFFQESATVVPFLLVCAITEIVSRFWTNFSHCSRMVTPMLEFTHSHTSVWLQEEASTSQARMVWSWFRCAWARVVRGAPLDLSEPC